MTMAENDEDARTFVETTLNSACEVFGLHQVPSGNNIFTKFTRQRDGKSLLIHVMSLGSILSVTGSSETDGIVRTLGLSPAEAHSVPFVSTHLISWLVNGGKYETSSGPHLQGLSPELLLKLPAYLDASSCRNLNKSNKAFHKLIPTEIPGPTTSENRRPSQWRFFLQHADIA